MDEVKKEEKKGVHLHITVLDDGNINVEGILNNEPIALWLLDKAKDIIKAYTAQQTLKLQPKIHKPGILDFARKKRF